MLIEYIKHRDSSLFHLFVLFYDIVIIYITMADFDHSPAPGELTKKTKKRFPWFFVLLSTSTRSYWLGKGKCGFIKKNGPGKYTCAINQPSFKLCNITIIFLSNLVLFFYFYKLVVIINYYLFDAKWIIRESKKNNENYNYFLNNWIHSSVSPIIIICVLVCIALKPIL